MPIASEEDLAVLNDLVDDRKRTIVVEPALFANEAFMTNLQTNERVASMLVLSSDETDAADLEFSTGSASTFNPTGNNVNAFLFPYPVNLLTEASSTSVRNRIAENLIRSDGFDNTLWQHASAVEFYAGLTDVTSAFCLDLERCNPIGGRSVWGIAGQDPDPAQSIVLFTIKLDSRNLFNDLSFAANDAASALIVLLAVADALNAHLTELSTLDKQIMIAAFQGESFDSVGSKRFIFDVQNNCQVGSADFDEETDSCSDFSFLYATSFNNVNFDNIEEIISVDNVAAYFRDIPTYFLHTQNEGALEAELTAQFAAAGLNIEQSSSVSNELPSTPIDTFANNGFTGEQIVIAGYDTDVLEANPFFQTRFDKAPPVAEGQDSVATASLVALSTAIARTLFLTAGGNASTAINVSASTETVQTMEFCLTQDFSCSLFKTMLNQGDDAFNSLLNGEIFTNGNPGTPLPARFFPRSYVANLISQRTLPAAVEVFTKLFLEEKLSFSVAEILAIPDDDDTISELTCVVDVDCKELASDEAGRVVLEDFCTISRPTATSCVRGRCVCSSVFFHDAVSPAVTVLGDSRFQVSSEIPAGFENDQIFTKAILEGGEFVELFQEGQSLTEILLMSIGVSLTLITMVCTKYGKARWETTKYKLL